MDTPASATFTALATPPNAAAAVATALAAAFATAALAAALASTSFAPTPFAATVPAAALSAAVAPLTAATVAACPVPGDDRSARRHQVCISPPASSTALCTTLCTTLSTTLSTPVLSTPALSTTRLPSRPLHPPPPFLNSSGISSKMGGGDANSTNGTTSSASSAQDSKNAASEATDALNAVADVLAALTSGGLALQPDDCEAVAGLVDLTIAAAMASMVRRLSRRPYLLSTPHPPTHTHSYTLTHPRPPTHTPPLPHLHPLTPPPLRADGSRARGELGAPLASHRPNISRAGRGG